MKLAWSGDRVHEKILRGCSVLVLLSGLLSGVEIGGPDVGVGHVDIVQKFIKGSPTAMLKPSLDGLSLSPQRWGACQI